MFAEKSPLRITALGELVDVQLMLVCIGFLRRQHAHEFQFEAKMIVAFASVFRYFQPERAIKRRQVSEAMRLEQRVGFDVAVINFIQGTRTTRRMAKSSQVGVAERVVATRVQCSN